jgi:outer membrane lipoprotein-sorting protein
VNILRRLPTSRLLLLCALVLAIGVSATALASALGSGPVPPQKPLAQAVHDALAAPSVEGVSANITLTDRLLEGANLASGTGAGSGGGGASLTSSPLVTGGSGRLWASKDGKVRLELQDEKGDTNIVYDGHTVTIYDAAHNTVYRYTPKHEEAAGSGGSTTDQGHETPSVAKIQEAIDHIRGHQELSEATATDVAGQPAYTVRLSPKEKGSLIGGAELSFDAVHGTPLRAAIYSSTSATPVIELAATEINYAAVPDSVFKIEPPSSAKVEELKLSEGDHSGTGQTSDHAGSGSVTTQGNGITSIVVAKTQAGKGGSTSSSLEGLPQVDVNGAKASELKTALGTILEFERAGTRYIVAGALGPGPIEAAARGL